MENGLPRRRAGGAREVACMACEHRRAELIDSRDLRRTRAYCLCQPASLLCKISTEGDKARSGMNRGKGCWIVAAALASVLSAPANAGFYSGDELFQLCTAERASSEYVEKTYECIAYIAGAVDAFNTTREANSLKSCLPPDVTVSRLRSVTIDYLRSNPSLRSGSASKLVFAATRAAWPCKKARKR